MPGKLGGAETPHQECGRAEDSRLGGHGQRDRGPDPHDLPHPRPVGPPEAVEYAIAGKRRVGGRGGRGRQSLNCAKLCAGCWSVAETRDLSQTLWGRRQRQWCTPRCLSQPRTPAPLIPACHNQSPHHHSENHHHSHHQHQNHHQRVAIIKSQKPSHRPHTAYRIPQTTDGAAGCRLRRRSGHRALRGVQPCSE
mgnify:CR=1 FL=1